MSIEYNVGVFMMILQCNLFLPIMVIGLNLVIHFSDGHDSRAFVSSRAQLAKKDHEPSFIYCEPIQATNHDSSASPNFPGTSTRNEYSRT